MMTPMQVYTMMCPMDFGAHYLTMITKSRCSRCARRDLNPGGMVGNHAS